MPGAAMRAIEPGGFDPGLPRICGRNDGGGFVVGVDRPHAGLGLPIIDRYGHRGFMLMLAEHAE
nr:hypothetical protein JVH1_1089 [Rhodococcus sp. JVH1]